jgi:FdhD protein
VSIVETFDVQIFGQSSQLLSDKVAVEEPLEIWLKSYTSLSQSETRHLSTTMRTPGHDIELVKGWLHALNVIPSADILKIEFTGTDAIKQHSSNRILITLQPAKNVDVSRLQRAQYASSSCGVCGQQSIEWMLDELVPIQESNRVCLSVAQIKQLSAKLRTVQPYFAVTGGMHGAGLINQQGEIVSVFEDVGRHNALDKLIGTHLRQLPGQYGVMLSGRVSFEMVQKVARAGLSMIVAIGAPTSLAVEMCKEFDIALIGFLRDHQFNLYHGSTQIR